MSNSSREKWISEFDHLCYDRHKGVHFCDLPDEDQLEIMRLREIGMTADGFRAAQPDASYEELRDRAEAAEAKLRAVSEAAKEKLETSSWYPEFYKKPEVDSLLSRIGKLAE